MMIIKITEFLSICSLNRDCFINSCTLHFHMNGKLDTSWYLICSVWTDKKGFQWPHSFLYCYSDPSKSMKCKYVDNIVNIYPKNETGHHVVWKFPFKLLLNVQSLCTNYEDMYLTTIELWCCRLTLSNLIMDI